MISRIHRTKVCYPQLYNEPFRRYWIPTAYYLSQLGQFDSSLEQQLVMILAPSSPTSVVGVRPGESGLLSLATLQLYMISSFVPATPGHKHVRLVGYKAIHRKQIPGTSSCRIIEAAFTLTSFGCILLCSLQLPQNWRSQEPRTSTKKLSRLSCSA